jgi:anti-sigma regulatory factor (Ser/Thr protein kinase)
MAGEELPSNTETEISLEGNDWVLPTSLKVFEPAEEALAERLKAAGWSDDEVDNLVNFGFHEILANAIVHGNLGIKKFMGSELKGLIEQALKDDPGRGKKKVFVTIVEITEKRAEIKIRDQGGGFDLSSNLDPTESENLLKVNGRGIFVTKENYGISIIQEQKGSNEVKIVKERE